MSKTVPEGWAIHPLNGKVDILSGFPFKSSLFCDDPSKMGVIRIRDLAKQSVETFYAGDFDDFYVVRRGDILIGMDGDFNIVKWKTKNALLNQRICKVKASRSGGFDSDFLFYSLVDDLDSIHAATGATTVKHLSVKDIKGIEKAYPPLPEQKKIAAILSSVDEVIEKTRAQIDKLKNLKTGMMQELLTKGIGPGGVPHTEFKDSQLGQIPVGWDVVEISSITSDITYGLTVRPKYVDEGIPLVSGKECKDGWLDFSISNRISEADFSGLRVRTLPQAGDVIMTKTGTVGRVALVQKSYQKFAISQNVALIRPNHSKVDPEYLALVLSSSSVKEQIRLGVSTLSVPDLQLGTLQRFNIPLPSKDEQKAIVSLLGSIIRKKAYCDKRLEQLNALKKALMQDLLTGKVRVQVDTRELAEA